MFPGFGAIAGATIGGLLGNSGAKDTNEAQLAEAERNRKFQHYMSNTAYQRKVEDMKKAGLNPLLAATGGGGQGASTPSGSQAQLKDEGAATVAGASAGAAAGNSAKSVHIQELAQVSQAELNSANTKSAEAQTVKTLEEAKNVASQTALNEARTREAIATAHSIEGRKGLEGDVYGMARKGLSWLTNTATKMFGENTGGSSPNSAVDVRPTVTDKVLGGNSSTSDSKPMELHIGGVEALKQHAPPSGAAPDTLKGYDLALHGGKPRGNDSEGTKRAYAHYMKIRRGK